MVQTCKTNATSLRRRGNLYAGVTKKKNGAVLKIAHPSIPQYTAIE